MCHKGRRASSSYSISPLRTRLTWSFYRSAPLTARVFYVFVASFYGVKRPGRPPDIRHRTLRDTPQTLETWHVTSHPREGRPDHASPPCLHVTQNIRDHLCRTPPFPRPATRREAGSLIPASVNISPPLSVNQEHARRPLSLTSASMCSYIHMVPTACPQSQSQTLGQP